MWTPEERADFNLLRHTTDSIAQRVGVHGFDSLRDVERRVYAVWCLDADVNNGGFDQYFFNSWGDWWPVALDGLVEVGAHETATILRRALTAFPEPPSTDREVRCVQLEALSDDAQGILDSATDQFYERPDDLEALLAAYLRAGDAQGSK